MPDVAIPRRLLDEIIGFCIEALPNEACGLCGGVDGVVGSVYRIRNTDSSPASFFMDPAEQFRAMKDMRASGLGMTLIWHSHPCSSPFPSAKDVSMAFYHDVPYLVVGFERPGNPVVGVYEISGETVTELRRASEDDQELIFFRRNRIPAA